MALKQAIYIPGSLNLETVVNADGIVAYSGGKTLEEYLFDAENKGQIVFPFDEAMKLIDEEHDKLSSQAWKEITEQDYTFALECLPPSRWERVQGVEFFQSRERYSCDVTSTYAQYDKKYFSALRKTSCDYETLSAEIKELAHV